MGKKIERIFSSFRDPSGFVYTDGERIFRVILKSAQEEWQKFVESKLFSLLQEKRYLQSTKLISLRDYQSWLNFSTEEAIALVEHDEKIPFISYPYEWPFSMLRDAALFHLEFLKECLNEGFITKDGTPYNIQFIGTKPTFIDILSIISYREGNPWVGFGQFSQLFLYPLFLMSYKGIPFQPWLRSELEGMDVYTVRKFFSFWDIFKPGIFSNIFILAKLQKLFSAQKESIKDKIFSSGTITRKTIHSHILRLYKIIKSLPAPRLFSLWDKYENENIYSAKDKEAKHNFILESVRAVRPSLLLDLGANTGEYSILSASYAKYVVAIDNDYQAIDTFYNSLKETKVKNVLPLIGSIVNPAPDLGWKLAEHSSFFHRLKPDMVLCLALLHHIRIGNNIPLQDFVEWLIGLAPNTIIEFVKKEDPMVKILLKEKADTYSDYNEEVFEYHLKKHGKIVKKYNLSLGSRALYFFKRSKNHD